MRGSMCHNVITKKKERPTLWRKVVPGFLNSIGTNIFFLNFFKKTLDFSGGAW